MAAQRHVDSVPARKDAKNVKVLVLGLSRTATMSMHTALTTLGYSSYHMSECVSRTKDGHLSMWNEAILAKYGPELSISPSSSTGPAASPKPSPYTAADFSKLLGDYDALSDIPSVLFVPELLAANPDAKLILTTHPRGVDSWLRSMGNSYFRISNWGVWTWPLMIHDARFSLPYMILVRRVLTIWTGVSTWPAAGDLPAVRERLRIFYAEHNEKIKTLARESGRDLLEFEPAMGWGPLCEFLGNEVPKSTDGAQVKYPRVNEGDSVVNMHKIAVVMRLWSVFGGTVVKAIGTAAVAGLAWWWLKW